MAKKAKIGRNDPCPCGSGKKYKNCCGSIGDITPVYDDPFAFYSQLIMSAKMKIDRYFKNDIKKHRRELRDRFNRFTVKHRLKKEHETIFSDWMWFDIKDDKGLSMGDNYLNENEAYLETAIRQVMRALNHSYLSVYRVDSCKDKLLTVSDILLGKSYQVLIKENLEMPENSFDLLLLARLLELEQTSVFSGMVLTIVNDSGQDEYIKEHFNYLSELFHRDTAAILADQAEITYGIFDHAEQKMFMNLNDMRFWQLTPDEASLLADTINTDSAYELVHQCENMKWFKPSGNIPGYSRTVIGDTLALSCADIVEVVNKQQKFINHVFPDKELQFLNSSLLLAPPAPEYKQLWFTVMKDQECEKWLSTPHRELDGKTPENVIKEEQGKDRLITMLNDFLTAVSSTEEKELIKYMMERVNYY